MPRAPKKCGHRDCSARVVGRTYCPKHEAQRQATLAQRRGTTSARGYGAAHQRQRAAWAPKVATGTVKCWRCGELIKRGEAWDLGHDDHDRSITRGPEHARRCNRSAAGQTRGAGSPPPPPPG